MGTILWIVQAVLAVKLLHTAITHGLMKTRVQMKTARQRLGATSHWVHAVTGVACFVGALSLIIPQLAWGEDAVTGLAAIYTAVLWLVGLLLHWRSREKPNTVVSLVLVALASFLAYGYLS